MYSLTTEIFVVAADEMEQELDDELLLRPVEGEVIANGFTFKHDQVGKGIEMN